MEEVTGFAFGQQLIVERIEKAPSLAGDFLEVAAEKLHKTGAASNIKLAQEIRSFLNGDK